MNTEIKLFAIYCALMAFIFGALVYAYTHPKFAKVEVVYDCGMLMGGWHPDVPAEVIKQCRLKMKKGVNHVE